MMRITTKLGDKGITRLCGGKPVSKCDLRIKAQGALDELISFLGLAKAKMRDASAKKKINLVQKDLFKIIGCISSGRKVSAHAIEGCDIKMLEEFGDVMERRGIMPSGFVVPGANEVSAILHIARTVARRAECSAVELNEKYKIDPAVLAYLNRLSDFLFVLALLEERHPASVRHGA